MTAPTRAPAARSTQPSTSIRRVLRHPAENAETLESVALVVGAGAFVIGLAVGWIVFWGDDVPISGAGSLGQFAGVGGAAVAFIAFLLGRIVLRTPAPALRSHVDDGLEVSGARLHWFDVVALAVAHAVIVLLGWIGLADVLERSFIGAVVFTFPAAVLAGTAFAVTGYAVFLSAARLTPMLLSLVVAVFLVVGALAAMLSSSDPLWWQKNLSALGMTDDISSLAFNLTLIIAGAIVTIIARYGTANLPTSTPVEVRRRSIVRAMLALIGVLLACVGIFPVDEFFALHNTVATGMAVTYAVIVFALPRLVPSMPKVFVILGYVYVAVVVLLGVFFAIGYYNLTAVELVAGVLIFSWIILFLRNAGVIRPEAPADAARPAGDRDADPDAVGDPAGAPALT
ncbi:hypothetical protein [Agromyces mariniharenae]|uniref:hypothetical protein n=1 Tax=Agromyces mariniharenae TaxID=2604423 RepID=UPI0016533972|nr:hypothetical protein [Agromyces mariniharenae]